ncbi:hypothetical protein TNIN_69771 [Trichonephila inaurata madagascariensis]|uniref:Uncharacterized protein n=1 Tax=Trichonephila inaurata madagascariensis TaxID=2747483 RepID=A0A8X6XYY3_9ARAC|nr:hypothetical protein TNIN_69771 [Trichonephila inaurata madagascariensis]
MMAEPKRRPPFHPLREKEPECALGLLPNFSSRFQVGRFFDQSSQLPESPKSRGAGGYCPAERDDVPSMLRRTAEYEGGGRKRPRNLHIASTIPPPTSSASLMRTAAP